MKNIKFSIIVPVYNVEKYISECLSSISAIKYSNFEVIIVNDGSTDNSVSIIETFLSDNLNFKLVNKPNEGLGFARNTGIENATGEYLIFIDSDDYYLSDQVLNKLNRCIEKYNSDIICFNHALFHNLEKKFIYRDKLNVSETDNIKKMIKNDAFANSACTKCIKASYIIDNEIYFNKGFSEDLDFSYRLLLFTDKINCIDEFFYCYRINRVGSITSNINNETFVNWVNIYNRCKSYREQYKNRIIEKSNSDAYLSNLYSNVVVGLCKTNKHIEYLGFIKDNKYILKNNVNSKGKILKIMYAIFGVRNACNLISFFRSKKRT